jgi:GxxExxY protein
MAEILYKEESYRIIGSCMTVHKKLGAGFLESVYMEALAKQFDQDKIQYVKEAKLKIRFDEVLLDKYFKADFVCFDKVIVEIKATPFIHKNDLNQVLNYLKATDFKLGLLINFGEKSLSYKRIINLPTDNPSCNS